MNGWRLMQLYREMDVDKTRYRSDTKCHFSRNKALESIALHNKINENIEGIKEDIALLKEILEKIINIYQAHDTHLSI